MNLVVILVLLAVLLETVVFIIYRIHRKKFHLIQNTETSKITTLKTGFYEIKGKVVCQSEKLVSPLTKKSCVYYKFKVEEQRSSGKSSHWITLINDEKFVRFAVQDSSGMAMLDIQGAKLKLNKDVKGNSGLFKKVIPELEETLKQYGKTSKGWIFEKSLRYEELFLLEGDELYVLGEVTDFESYYPVFKKDTLPFIISDKPEEELLRGFRHIMQIALFFLLAIPGALVIYLVYHFSSS